MRFSENVENKYILKKRQLERNSRHRHSKKLAAITKVCCNYKLTWKTINFLLSFRLVAK